MIKINDISLTRRKILQTSLLILIFSMFNLCEISRLIQVNSIPQRIMNAPLLGRYGHSLVYDPENQQIILFGGYNMENGELDDMWVYDCTNNIWRELHLAKKPLARSGQEMVYNSINRKFILFGGSTRYGWSNDTWIYDSAAKTWTEVFPKNRPSPRGSVSMYFDPDIGQTILFGGYIEELEGADETWTYDYDDNIWNLLNISVKPRPRYGSRMIYDPVNQRGVLFGGRIIGYYKLNDTWEFNLLNYSWTQLDLPEHPSPRYWHDMVYDSAKQVIMLFGGSIKGGLSQETWIFNVTSNRWIQMNPEVSPSNRSFHKLVYDSENGKVIMFGGVKSGYSETYNDTWIYSFDENNWTKQKPQIVEYSPVPCFNIPIITSSLITLYILNTKKRRLQRSRKMK